MQIVDSAGTKKPIWDLQNILLEQDGSNVTQAVYTLEPAGYGNLISQRRSSTTSFYLFDALGSTRMLTSSAGASTDTYNFKAFGETWNSTGSTTNVFRWVGKLGYYYDVDRLAYYLRARPYSPKLARFLSYDPIGVAGGLNLFGYVNNRASVIKDPSGYLQCNSNRPGLEMDPSIYIPLLDFPLSSSGCVEVKSSGRCGIERGGLVELSENGCDGVDAVKFSLSVIASSILNFNCSATSSRCPVGLCCSEKPWLSMYFTQTFSKVIVIPQPILYPTCLMVLPMSCDISISLSISDCGECTTPDFGIDPFAQPNC